MCGRLFVCGRDRSPLKDLTPCPSNRLLPWIQRRRGHRLPLTQFPFFPLPGENNPGVFMRALFSGTDILDWYRE